MESFENINSHTNTLLQHLCKLFHTHDNKLVFFSGLIPSLDKVS